MQTFLIAYTVFNGTNLSNERVRMPASNLDEAFAKVKAAVELIGWEFVGAMLLRA